MSPAPAIPRLRTRAALAFAAVAALLAVGLAWVVIDRLDRVVAQRVSDELAGRIDRVDAELQLLRDVLREDLDALVRRLHDDVGSLRALRAGGTRAVEVADALARGAGVDELWLIAGDGTLIASTWWPERAGLPAPALPRVDVTGIVIVERPDRRPQPFVTSAAAVPALGPGVRAVVGAQLDRRLLARVAGADEAELICAGDPRPVASWAGRAAGAEGSTPTVGERALVGLDGTALAVVRVRVTDDGWATARRAARREALWLGVVAALVAGAAGFVVAGRIARPVERLVRAVGQIDAGEADYGFERPAGDELDAVAGSISRTHRALELQRARSTAAERVAAWREVARRVAHEVKNPLAPIRLTAQNLRRARQTDPVLFDELFDDGVRTILEEVAQLERLVGEFSEFARLPAPRRRACDPAALLDDVLALHRAEPGLVVERHGAASVPGARLDEDQIRRALGNVVGNAVEAMRELDPETPRRLEAGVALDDGVVAITVRDSGPGPPAGGGDTMLRPYFTTKSGGTGLGLAIVDRIVTEHGGILAVERVDDGGCRIVIRLPLDGAPPGAGESA